MSSHRRLPLALRLFMPLILMAAALHASTVLFSNGIPDSGTNGGNFLDCSNCRSAAGVTVYDNFLVGAGGWQVTGLFGDYFTSQASPLPTTATWDIRQGISQGNSGTLIASGDSPVTLTPLSTPPNGSPADTYFRVNLNVSSVSLAPGTYWLAIAPESSANETFLVGTDGSGGVNQQIDGVSYVIGTYWSSMQEVGAYLQPFTHSSSYDFSYGVIGNANADPPAPEPGTCFLLTAGCALAALGRARHRRKTSIFLESVRPH